MIVLLLAAFAQAATPTVGDTIWVERTAPVPPGHIARLPEWQLDGDVELLGEPALVIQGNAVVLRFPLVAWRPGSHTVTIPGPEFIAPDGRTVSLPSEERMLEVASVLPDEPAEDIPVRGAAGIVGRPVASLVPLGVMLALTGLILVPAWWWWIRRGRVVTEATPPPVMVPVPVSAWAEAGEQRVVLAAATDMVRHAVADRLPGAHPGLDTESCIAVLAASPPRWDAAPVVEVLRDLDLARFRPEGPGEVLTLCRRAEAVSASLSRAGEAG